MKKIIHTVVLAILLSTPGFAQWSSSINQVHTANNPIIRKFRPMLTLDITTATEHGGLRFHENGTPKAYFYYNNDTEELSLGNSLTPSQNAFTVHRSSGNAKLKGLLNLYGTGNVKIQAEGDQMLWYDHATKEASWGFSAAFNRFAKPISIGSGLIPDPGQSIVTSNSQDIALVGANSFIEWFTNINSDHTGPNAAFIGANPSGALLVESNLSEVWIDGEKGIAFLGKDLVRARMSSTGYWVLGGTMPDPNYRLCINGDVKITGEMLTASDRRMKENIRQLSSGLSTVLALNPVSYKYKNDQFESLSGRPNRQLGFIAQEVEEIMPNLVSTSSDTDINGHAIDAKALNYVQLIPVLTKAIQEQQAIIDTQAAQLSENTEFIKLLIAKIETLEK